MRNYGLTSKVIRASSLPAMAVETGSGTVVEANDSATAVLGGLTLLENDLFTIFPHCDGRLRELIATACRDGYSQLHTSTCGNGSYTLVLIHVDVDSPVLLATILSAPEPIAGSADALSAAASRFPALRLEPAWQLLLPLDQIHLLLDQIVSTWRVESVAVLHCHPNHAVVVDKLGKPLPWWELPLAQYAPLERSLQRGVCPVISVGSDAVRLAPLYVENSEVAWGAAAFTVTAETEVCSETAALAFAALVSAVLAHAHQKHAISGHQQQHIRALSQRDHLVRQSQRGMLLLNAAGNIEVINDRACNFLNWKHEDVVQRPLDNLLGTLGVLGTRLGATLQSRPNSRAELSGRLDRRNMRGRDLDIILEPVPNEHGSYWIYISDPTLAVTGGAVPDETSQYLGRIHQLNVTLHEMKTPLTGSLYSVDMLADMLNKSDLLPDSPIITTVATVREKIHDALQMIRDFSNWVTVGQKPNFEFCDLKVIAEEAIVAVELARRGRLSRPIRIRRAFEAHVPLIEGDSRRLHQMLTNLLNNAAEAITKEDGEVEVAIRPLRRDQLALYGIPAERTRVLNNGVEVRVRDSGLGMTKAQMLRIFDPEVSFKLGGTGVGLWLVRTVVEQHGGEIRVDSELGVGTTFAILMPQRIDGLTGND